MIVLPGARLVHARRAAEAMRTAIAELEAPNPRGEPIRVTASIGVAGFPTYATPEALRAAAAAAQDPGEAGLPVPVL